MTAKEFVKARHPQDYDDIPQWHIDEMEAYAAQQSKMPTEEEVHKAYVNFQWALAATDDYHEGLEHGFKAGVEWLRNQIER